MKHYIPDEILVEKSVSQSPITHNVLTRLPHVPVTPIDSTEAKLDEARTWNPALARAKRSLILAEHKGHFFKPCPGQQSRGDSKNVCCNYFVVNFASNCHMECSYCYLQSYLNFPYMIVYANLDKLLFELDETLSAQPDRLFRVGTGELADSLALDPLSGYSVPLVEFFAQRDNSVLELKTKSDCVEELLGLDHQGRTTVAWSMNPAFIQQTEEHKTSTVEERLHAAARCVDAGYPVAFHFDPIVHYPGWQEGYPEVVKQIFSTVPQSAVAWISLGALRLSPTLKEIMKRRFPKSALPYGELILAEDGKFRYFKPIRVEMYQALVGWIEEFGQGTTVYACMERPQVWQKVFGKLIPTDEEIGDSLVQVLS